jgi:hypothetical protein
MAYGKLVYIGRVAGLPGTTTMPSHPPSSGVSIDAKPPRAATRNACMTIRSVRDQRR